MPAKEKSAGLPSDPVMQRLSLCPKRAQTDYAAYVADLRQRVDALSQRSARHCMPELLHRKLQLDYLLSKQKALCSDPVPHADSDAPLDARQDAMRQLEAGAGQGQRFRYLPHRSVLLESMTENVVDIDDVDTAAGTKNKGTATEAEIDVCADCGVNMKVCSAKSIMVCDQCGLSKAYMDVTVNALPYNNTVDVTSFSYKRINHFNDWLFQIQGKEGKSVPDDVIDQVVQALKRERVLDMSQITTHKVRDVLKSLRLNKMYEHVTQITCKVTGQEPPHLSAEIEEKCRLMFIAIQVPFEQHCPADRKNFLSYPYCLFKFLQLLGCTHVLKSFILLKGKDKLQKQDMIFEKICSTLGWEFIPST